MSGKFPNILWKKTSRTLLSSVTSQSGKRLPRREGSEALGGLCAERDLCCRESRLRLESQPWRPSYPLPLAPLTILPADERQEARRAARLLVNLTLPVAGSLQALEVHLQLVFQFFRGGQGSRAPGLSDQQRGAIRCHPQLWLVCSRCQPAPPNRLVPRPFAFISVKTDFAVGYSLEVANKNCLGFLKSFWDRCYCQSNSGPKSWALEFIE